MKFQQLLALQKHIESSCSLGQIPKAFLVMHQDKEERKRLLEKLSSKLLGIVKGSISLYGSEEVGAAYGMLVSPSLFGGNELVVLDGVKEFPPEMEQRFSSWVLKPSAHAFLFIGGESVKALAPFYDKTKKELLFLDMTEEKSWDKEKRLQQEILLMVKGLEKTITPGALNLLLQSGTKESIAIESELLKVLCFIGDRKGIIESDIKAVGTPSIHEASWQQAESLIWEGRFLCDQPDLSFLIAFLGQVRFLLQQARQVVFCLEQKKEPQDICKIANIKPFVLQKLQERIRKYAPAYFNEAIDFLYEMDLEMKGGASSPAFLVSLLQIEFTKLRKTYGR